MKKLVKTQLQAQQIEKKEIEVDRRKHATRRIYKKYNKILKDSGLGT